MTDGAPAGDRRGEAGFKKGITEFPGVDLQGTIYSGASSRPGILVHELFRLLD